MRDENASGQEDASYSSVAADYRAAALQDLVERLKAAIPEIALAPVKKNGIELELQTLELQIVSLRANGAVITRCLRSIRATLEASAGSSIPKVMIVEIDKVRRALGH